MRLLLLLFEGSRAPGKLGDGLEVPDRPDNLLVVGRDVLVNEDVAEARKAGEAIDELLRELLPGGQVPHGFG